MTKRVYNFTAGPAMLPLPVLERVQAELLDYDGLGASVIEISHLSEDFKAILFEAEALLRELMGIPEHYKVVFAHGGGQMQFSMVPLNLIGLKPGHKAAFVESGNFSERAVEEARRYGTSEVVASSQGTSYDRIPEFDPEAVDPHASYLHITTNNTIMGTRWPTFPATPDGVPLVGDMTSEILSRPVDVSQFGLIYAGAQKNLGPSGLAIAIVREDLLGHALPFTPKLLDYARLAQDRSLTNTVNTFSIYVTGLVLKWVREQGGVAAMERRAEERARIVYAALDKCADFYRPHARPEHRATMNVTFRLPTEELDAKFIADGLERDLYGMKGHKRIGGIRCSLYNGMPMEGATALAAYIEDFAQRHG